MGRGYEKEMRFYVHVITEYEDTPDGGRVAKGEPKYIHNEYLTTEKFIDAQHFASFDEAKKEAEAWKVVHPRFTYIVRSLYVEVNGFDLGAII